MIILILLVVLLIVLGLIMYHEHKKAIRSVVPGAKFVFKREDGNPFLDDKDYRYVVEVQNGWVLYKCGKDGSAIHTSTINDFIEYKEIVKTS